MTSIKAQQILKLLFLLLATSMTVSPSASEAENGHREQILVSTQWLKQHLGDEKLVLLHVGPKDDFEQEHIAGARELKFSDISPPHDHSSGTLTLELPEPADLQQVLRDLGINQDSKIVVYWSSRFVTPTTRIIFTLDWAGLGDQTVLLDGGLAAWKADGNPVGQQAVEHDKGTVNVEPNNRVVDADWIKSHLQDDRYALVDARAPAYFDGISEDTHKKGHIPGSGSLPWVTLLDDSVKLKPASELRELLTRAGIKPGDTVVAYCHIGQFATMALFAARSLGHEVLLYDGAWQDWASHDLPVETAP